MKRKRILAVFLLSIFMLQCVITTYPAQANETFTTQSELGLSPTDTNILQHSSGKFVYVWLDTATETAYAEIFSSSGSYEARITETLGITWAGEINVVEWDNDEFVITVAGYDGTLHTALFILCNINTYSHTEYEQKSGTQVYATNKGSWVANTQGLIYYFTQFGSGGATPYPRELFVYTFNGTDGAMTRNEFNMDAGGTTKPWGIIQGFLGEGIYDDKAYLIIPKDADNQKPVYYEYDLDGHTITELATHPMSARYHDDDDIQFQHYLGGGIETSGTYVYLHHSWVYSYVSGVYRLAKMIQHRLVFNNTLAVANLTAQSEIVATITPSVGTGSDPTWIHGYMDDYDEVVLYHAGLDGSDVVASKLEMSISNWLNYAGNAQFDIDQFTHDSGEFNFYDDDDAVRRDFNSPFQVGENSFKARVYTQLFIPQADYSITMSYSPTDSPLYTDTSYRITVTATRNNLGFIGTILGYFDGSNIISQRTESNGVLQFTFTTSLAGYHNLTFSLYDGSTYTGESVSYNYLFQKEDDEIPSSSALLPQSVAITTEFIPIALITLVPASIFATILGLIGGVFGLNLGIIIAVGSGILPGYTIYLMLLFDAMFAIFIMKSGE